MNVKKYIPDLIRKKYSCQVKTSNFWIKSSYILATVIKYSDVIGAPLFVRSIQEVCYFPRYIIIFGDENVFSASIKYSMLDSKKVEFFE